jgi:hypothetical protein
LKIPRSNDFYLTSLRIEEGGGGSAPCGVPRGGGIPHSLAGEGERGGGANPDEGTGTLVLYILFNTSTAGTIILNRCFHQCTFQKYNILQ